MKLQTLNSSLLENLEPMLNESIYHFLVEFQKGRTDFSELSSIFFRLTQTMTDPPLEFIWFYSAVTFLTAKSSNIRDSHNFLLSVKDLFHSLVSFQSPSDNNYLNQVSLVAPVLYQLVNFKFENSRFKTEIEGLVDAIVTHIVLCCNNDFVEQEVRVYKSSVSWVSVVPIWIADQVVENQGRVDGLQLFFPLSTEDIRHGINEDSGMAYLAGIVMIESLLLRLCLMFDSEASRNDFHKDVKSYAAQIIIGFKKNSTFLVMLFKMLLEPSLPVSKLLATTDEHVLRRLLFDVVFDLGCDTITSTQLSDVQYKEIVILWLFVTNSALQFASENGDHAGVDFYMNGFSASQLPHHIISWVAGGTNTQPTTPDISSPKDLIGWLLVMEKQGLKMCNYSISGLHEKISNYKSTEVNNGVKDEDSMIEDAPIRINGRRKRDMIGFEGEVQKQIKVIKCCHENQGNDGFRGKHETGNAVSDQEMVDMVR